mgnify:FL=1
MHSLKTYSVYYKKNELSTTFYFFIDIIMENLLVSSLSCLVACRNAYNQVIFPSASSRRSKNLPFQFPYRPSGIGRFFFIETAFFQTRLFPDSPAHARRSSADIHHQSILDLFLLNKNYYHSQPHQKKTPHCFDINLLVYSMNPCSRQLYPLQFQPFIRKGYPLR